VGGKIPAGDGEDIHEDERYCRGNCHRGRRWRRRPWARLSIASHHHDRAVPGGRADGYAPARLGRAHEGVARPARGHPARGRARAPAKAGPEGKALGTGSWRSHVGAGAMYPAAHDAVLELQPVSRISATPLMIIGKNALPPKNAKELITWLKANPGRASAATV